MSPIIIPPPPLSYIGWGALDKLTECIKKYGSNVLLVADPVLVKIGITEKIITTIISAGCSYDQYSDIIPEPTLQTGEDLVRFVRLKAYSLVIGIGGGSALDMAKLAAVFARNPGELKDYLNLSGNIKITQPALPKILVPTTSGTGAEVTDLSVLALEHSKDVIMHEYLRADVAIIDPELTLTVPPRITAATGADALTHAIESYLSVNANPYSDGLALQAIRLIGRSLKRAVTNGNDREARTDLSYGSYLAGLAFASAGVGAIHALAYPLGGQFHLAHGESNAVLIPFVLGYIRNACALKLSHILQALPGNDTYGDVETASIKCVETLAGLMKDIGIPETLGGFNIPATAARSLTEDAVKQTRLLARCPMPLSEEDIFRIYEAAASVDSRTSEGASME